MQSVAWYCKRFDQLTPFELYAILQLRNEVFVVEQNCVFQDADNKDQESHHFMGMIDGVLVAYTRLVPPGIIYTQASIGRVITSPKYRAQKLGRELMEKSIEKAHELFGKGEIKIGAQYYLKKFYESLGFTQTGDEYDEDGIKHIHMLLT